MVFGIFGLAWVIPQNVLALMECWKGILVGIVVRLFGGAIPPCLMWIIWREQKPSNFDGFEYSPSELKLLLLRTLYDRMTARSSHSCSNLLEFLDLCNLS